MKHLIVAIICIIVGVFCILIGEMNDDGGIGQRVMAACVLINFANALFNLIMFFIEVLK